MLYVLIGFFIGGVLGVVLWESRRHKIDNLTVILLLVALLLILFSIYAPTLFTQYSSSIYFDENTGVIGDTIGGIMNPFISIAAVIVMGLAFYAQYRANDMIRKQFKIQQFEKRFYEMLNQYKNMLVDVELKFQSFGSINKIKGIDVFIQVNDEIKNNGDVFKKKQEQTFKLFDRYFEYILRIIKYVDNQIDLTDLDKRDYIDSLKMQMSNDELKMLFYYLKLGNRYYKEYHHLYLIKYGMLRYLPYTEMYCVFDEGQNEFIKNTLIKLIEEYKKTYKGEKLFEIGDDVNNKFKTPSSL